jgi:hypothetical protein
MMMPDASKHNPDPEYLRGLIKQASISIREAARRIGINERLLRMYLADRQSKSAQNCTYPVQFCLEMLAMNGSKQEIRHDVTPS